MPTGFKVLPWFNNPQSSTSTRSLPSMTYPSTSINTALSEMIPSDTSKCSWKEARIHVNDFQMSATDIVRAQFTNILPPSNRLPWVSTLFLVAYYRWYDPPVDLSATLSPRVLNFDHLIGAESGWHSALLRPTTAFFSWYCWLSAIFCF